MGILNARAHFHRLFLSSIYMAGYVLSTNFIKIMFHCTLYTSIHFVRMVTVQGPPPNVAQPASMHGYCGVNFKYWSKIVCRTPADPHFSAAPE